MRAEIQPELVPTTVTCGTCGTGFETRSTVRELRLDVCSHCHPAYTGQAERRADGTQVERFNRRWGTSRPAFTPN